MTSFALTLFGRKTRGISITDDDVASAKVSVELLGLRSSPATSRPRVLACVTVIRGTQTPR